MARNRMYLFERAYREYAVRLRGLSSRLLKVCGDLWQWFWRGPGARVMEVLLQILVVASAIAMAVMYIQYEQAQGRSFSGGTVAVIVIILIYVTVLLWGWKSPVHFGARVVSSAAAAGSVLVLALLAIAIAGSGFLAYLAVLTSLTALSFILFLPMRGAHMVWLLRRRISYQCPYDDCPYNGMPIHLCECGERYRDLQPSFYGIFHHKCRHPDRELRLATMDWWGRNKLPRLCGGCERPLIHSSLGELPEWPIAIVGGASAGKTVFLLQATRRLREQLSAQPGCVVRIDAADQERDYQEKIEQLERGQVVAKTAGDVMQAFGLSVRAPKGLRCLLYLFDKPGEDFATMQRFGRMQVVQHVKGLVLLVDPFSLPALTEYAQRLGAGLKASEEPFSKIVHNLINSVNLMLLRRPEDKCDVPVAIVLSKADALPTSDYPFLKDLYQGDGLLVDEVSNTRCREALNKLGASSSVRELEMKFSRLRYFSCSALGRLPELRDTKPFQPRGVTEPLLWLLDMK
jgi:Double-GTPase 2